MRAALERGRAERVRAAAVPVASIASLAPPLLLGGLVVLVGTAVFGGGGSTDRSIPWIGGAAVALAGSAVAAALAGAVPWPRLTRAGAASVACLAAFVVWNGLTVLWSVAPDRSWSYFNRGLVYVAFLVLGLFAAALVPRAPRRIGAGLALVVAAALAWALAGKVVPALFPDGARFARLRDPIGFWNALALLFVFGLPLALWLSSDRGRRIPTRAAAAVFLYALVAGILLTYSRGGLLVALAAVAAWLVISRETVQSLLSLAVAVPAGVAVALWAFRQPGIAADRQPYATRVADGAEFGVALVLTGAVVFAVAFLAFRLDPVRRLGVESRRLLARGAVVAAAALATLAVATAAANAGDVAGWLEAQAAEFKNPPTELVTQDASRLTTVSSNNRWTWWQEAWRLFLAKPVTGTGAGSFPVAHLLVRDNALHATAPHNVGLQFLSETGVVGAFLAGFGALFAVVAAAGAVRKTRGRERSALVALAVILTVYLLHALVDWDWDFLAVSAPVFAAAGVLLAAGARGGRSRRDRLWALAPAAFAAVAISSLAAPWLADRRVDEAYAALADGRAGTALRSADDASSLNPLSLEPLFARATAQQELGDLQGARASLVRAVELQPLNPSAWYELGAFELEVARRPQAALPYLERAHELDPYGPARDLLAAARSG